MLLRVVAGVVGLLVTLVIARSLVTDLLVPRPLSSLLTRFTRVSVQFVISAVARTGWSYQRQHRILSAVGPLMVVFTLFLAVLGFLAAFALIIYAVTGVPLDNALLQSGSGLLTLGLVQVDDPVQVAVTFLAAFTGMVIIAVLVGYLLLLFTAYSDRETGVTKSAMWAGEPAWGPEILCRRHLAGSGPQRPHAEGWVDWVCQVRVSHTMYPLLAYFRSSGAMRGWVSTTIARMDAAALEVVATPHPHAGDLATLLAEGGQTLALNRMLLEPLGNVTVLDELTPVAVPTEQTEWPAQALYWAIRRDSERTRQHVVTGRTAGESSLTRADFDEATALMARAGLELVADLDDAWERFRAIRAQYEQDAYQVAYWVNEVPAPWTGPRRRPMATVWPTRSADLLKPT